MLKIESKRGKDNVGVEIKGASNPTECLATIIAIRDYIFRNEQGSLTKKEINKIIIEALCIESEGKK